MFFTFGEMAFSQVKSELSKEQVVPIVSWEEDHEGKTVTIVPVFKSRDVARDFAKRNLKPIAPIQDRKQWIYGVLEVLQEHLDFCEDRVNFRLFEWTSKVSQPLNLFMLEVKHNPLYKMTSNVAQGDFSDIFS